jgi:prepilin-type N-terminal cleavage/methylation domain-containing protein
MARNQVTKRQRRGGDQGSISSPSEQSALLLKGQKGFTLIELIVVIAIIGILSVLSFNYALRSRSAALGRVEGSALDLQRFLNYARMASMGSQNVVVFFGNNFYGGCVDGQNNETVDGLCTALEQCIDENGNGACDAGEPLAPNLPMPDTQDIGGSVLKGVNLQTNTLFGTVTGTNAAADRLGGSISQGSDGSYYSAAGGTAIGDGLATDLTDVYKRIYFNRNGLVESGTIYLAYKKDDDNTFNYAIQVTGGGKVILYEWAQVDGNWVWKMK